MAASLPALFQILLVIVLCAPEGLRRLNFGHNALRLEAAFGASGASILASACASCSGEWKKIAERYCVPQSGPWRLRVVGS